MTRMIAKRPYSTRPDEAHLQVWLSKTSDGQLVTWIHDVGVKSFDEGHYHDDLEAAIADFVERGTCPYKTQLNGWLDVDLPGIEKIGPFEVRNDVMRAWIVDAILEAMHDE